MINIQAEFERKYPWLNFDKYPARNYAQDKTQDYYKTFEGGYQAAVDSVKCCGCCRWWDEMRKRCENPCHDMYHCSCTAKYLCKDNHFEPRSKE